MPNSKTMREQAKCPRKYATVETMQDAGNSFIHPERLWRDVGLAAGQTVVHLGCGAGFYLVPAAKLIGASGKAIGIDLLPDLLAETENRAAREGVDAIVHTIRANIELPNGSTLPDQSSDWVLVANILHQSDPQIILTEAARIVGPTGSVLAIEWDTIATPLGPPTDQRISQQTVREIADNIGLFAEETFAPSPYHYGFVFTLGK